MISRHEKVCQIIQGVAAKFIQHEANTNPLITVTRVSISPDYRNCTVYFTTIPDDRQDDALIFLQRNGRELRQRIKRDTNLKYIPNVSFSVDYGERHRQHIDTIVHELEDGD